MQDCSVFQPGADISWTYSNSSFLIYKALMNCSCPLSSKNEWEWWCNFSMRSLRAVGSGIVHFNKEIGALDRSGSRILWTDTVNPSHCLKWEKGKAGREIDYSNVLLLSCCGRRLQSQVCRSGRRKHLSPHYSAMYRTAPVTEGACLRWQHEVRSIEAVVYMPCTISVVLLSTNLARHIFLCVVFTWEGKINLRRHKKSALLNWTGANSQQLRDQEVYRLVQDTSKGGMWATAPQCRGLNCHIYSWTNFITVIPSLRVRTKIFGNSKCILKKQGLNVVHTVWQKKDLLKCVFFKSYPIYTPVKNVIIFPIWTAAALITSIWKSFFWFICTKSIEKQEKTQYVSVCCLFLSPPQSTGNPHIMMTNTLKDHKCNTMIT